MTHEFIVNSALPTTHVITNHQLVIVNSVLTFAVPCGIYVRVYQVASHMEYIYAIPECKFIFH